MNSHFGALALVSAQALAVTAAAAKLCSDHADFTLRLAGPGAEQ